MATLELNMVDVAWLDSDVLRREIERASGVRVTMEIADLYQAESRIALAQNWLKTWYLSECLAKYASTAKCDFAEGEFGAGIVELELTIRDVFGFVERLVEFGPVFDPDESEAPVFIYVEAQEWLDSRGNAPALLSELEKCYRDDALAAEEYEEGRAKSGDCDDEETED